MILFILFILFLVFKLAGVILWSWWIVFLPLILEWLILIFLFTFVLINEPRGR